MDKRSQKCAKNFSPALAAQPGTSEVGWAFSASHTAISSSNLEINFRGELCIWHMSPDETPLACLTSDGQFVWNYNYPTKSYNFLLDNLWTGKDEFVHDAVPSDAALFYKHLLVDTTSTLGWSWFGIWALTGFCWNNSWVSLSRENQLKKGWSSPGSAAGWPHQQPLGAFCPSPAGSSSKSPVVLISLPLISSDIIDIFQIPLQCGKRELGPLLKPAWSRPCRQGRCLQLRSLGRTG